MAYFYGEGLFLSSNTKFVACCILSLLHFVVLHCVALPISIYLYSMTSIRRTCQGNETRRYLPSISLVLVSLRILVIRWTFLIDVSIERQKYLRLTEYMSLSSSLYFQSKMKHLVHLVLILIRNCAFSHRHGQVGLVLPKNI